MARYVIGYPSHRDLEVFVQPSLLVQPPEILVDIVDLLGEPLRIRVIWEKEWVFVLQLEGAGGYGDEDVKAFIEIRL